MVSSDDPNREPDRDQHPVFNSYQLSAIGREIIKIQNRNWFGGLFDPAAQPYLVPLLINLFLCYDAGVLASKKEAMRYMRAVDGRTSQRYIDLLKRQGFLNIVESSIDRRVDLLCPTEKLLELVRDELKKFGGELQDYFYALNSIASSPRFSVTSSMIGYGAYINSDMYSLLTKARRPKFDDPKVLSRAIAKYSAAIRDNPAEWQHRFHRALAYLSSGQFRKVISDATQIIRLKPDHGVAYALRGAARLALKERDRALADLNKSIELTPDFGPAHRWRVLAREQQLDDDQYFEEMLDALKHEETFNDSMRTAFGETAEPLTKREVPFKNMIARYSEMIQLAPSNAAAWRGRGDAHRNMALTLMLEGAPSTYKAEAAKAIIDYTEALRLNPKDSHALMERARVFRWELNYDQAIADANELVRLNPNKGFAYDLRSELYWEKGDKEKAEADRLESVKYGGPNNY